MLYKTLHKTLAIRHLHKTVCWIRHTIRHASSSMACSHLLARLAPPWPATSWAPVLPFLPSPSSLDLLLGLCLRCSPLAVCWSICWSICPWQHHQPDPGLTCAAWQQAAGTHLCSAGPKDCWCPCVVSLCCYQCCPHQCCPHQCCHAACPCSCL
jgi:hypothetical protein